MTYSFKDNGLDFIEEYLKGQTGGTLLDVQLIRSAQQMVLRVQLDCSVASASSSTAEQLWHRALQYGDNRLIVRIWKAGARWWNLNHTKEQQQQQPTPVTTTSNATQTLATAEIQGYRMARHAFENNNEIEIPQVLAYFQTGDTLQDDVSIDFPWAVLTYVGPESQLFRRKDSPKINSRILEDDSWTTGMIKVRQEYGFDEPHPRWGRVPVERALDYARMVLETFTIPLHQSTAVTIAADKTTYTQHYTYQDMVQLHQYWMQHLMNNQPSNSLWSRTMARLRNHLDHLAQKGCLQVASNLPPVLCHMDLQPQNLMFASTDTQPSKIVAVLDWEESAICDPRFELLLLGRKVCANQSQFFSIWQLYAQTTRLDLGPLEPWLILESIHSILTYLLQALNLGGRNPWESNSDLWGKLDRELERLEGYGSSGETRTN